MSACDNDPTANEQTAADRPDNEACTLDVDQLLLEAVRPAGLWQCSCALLLALTTNPFSLFPVFANSSGPHRCRMEPSVESAFVDHYVSFDQAARLVGPWPDEGGISRIGQGCSRYNFNWTGQLACQLLNNSITSNETEPCPLGYVFQHSDATYPGNVIEEFATVCDLSWLVPLGTSIYMIAMLFGFTLGGLCSDRFGRKTMILVAAFFEGLFGILTATAYNYTMYVSLRAFVGLFNTAKVSATNILLMELTTARYRSTMNAVQSSGIGFVSRSLMTLWASLLPNWRHLHTVLSLPCALIVVYAFIIPESPRWLHSKGKTRQAIQVLRQGLRINLIFGKRIREAETRLNRLLSRFDLQPRVERRAPDSSAESQTKLGPWARLVAYRNVLRISVIAVAYVLGLIMAVFGLLLYARIVRGSVYLVSFINSSTILPATILSLVLYRRFRRRKYPLFACSLLAIVALSAGSLYTMIANPRTDVVLTIASSIGLVMLGCCVNMMYVYLPELFPSEQRAYWFGIVLGIGRLGSFLATYINEMDHYFRHGTPVAIFAAVMAVSTGMLLLLDDTSGERMPDFRSQLQAADRPETK